MIVLATVRVRFDQLWQYGRCQIIFNDFWVRGLQVKLTIEHYHMIYIYIYIYICKLILGTNGRLSTHEWVQIWYLFGILCT